jgi:L-rhamnose mutarotase
MGREKLMEHVLFKQSMNPDRKEEYLEAHRNVWPDLLKLLRESGVEREFIWVEGENLYIYVMAKDFDRSLGYQGEHKLFQQWVEEMKPLLAEMQDYSEEGRIITLEKVFDLEEQLARLENNE